MLDIYNGFKYYQGDGQMENKLTIKELCKRSGFSERQIRDWTKAGILPEPEREHAYASPLYDVEALRRLEGLRWYCNYFEVDTPAKTQKGEIFNGVDKMIHILFCLGFSSPEILSSWEMVWDKFLIKLNQTLKQAKKSGKLPDELSENTKIMMDKYGISEGFIDDFVKIGIGEMSNDDFCDKYSNEINKMGDTIFNVLSKQLKKCWPTFSKESRAETNGRRFGVLEIFDSVTIQTSQNPQSEFVQQKALKYLNVFKNLYDVTGDIQYKKIVHELFSLPTGLGMLQMLIINGDIINDSVEDGIGATRQEIEMAKAEIENHHPSSGTGVKSGRTQLNILKNLGW